VDNRLLSDNVLRCLRCSYFSRDSRCSSGFLRRGGFLVACDWYAFNQFPEPRQKWIGSRHGDAVLTFFLDFLCCMERATTSQNERRRHLRYNNILTSNPVMGAGNISDTKRTLVVSAVLTWKNSVATLFKGLFSDWTLQYEWV
jgi:hypothetical protein